MVKRLELKNIKNKQILIKTYLSESGLWYLGESLGVALSENNNVCFVPKAKYKRSESRVFERFYPKPYDKTLLDRVDYVSFSANKSIRNQISEVIKERKVDIVFSLETFMAKAQWASSIRKTSGVRVVGIPMPEWAGERFVNNNSYRIFDDIWCLTDTSYNIFKKYPTCSRAKWDYVDRGLFVPAVNKDSISPLTFYHPGSVNPGFSQKNTNQVLRAFLAFEKNVEANLIVSGNLSDEDKRLAKKSKNIILINKVLDRGGVVSLYDKSHCVVLPSTREGLGLGFYEAKAMNCGIITTDVDPMNTHTDYLCEVISYNKSDSLVPFALTSSDKILEQLNRYYEDFKMSKTEVKVIKIEKKKKSVIKAENDALMAAFDDDESEVESIKESDEMSADVLSRLKAKMENKKEEEEPVKVVDRRSVSIEFAVIGAGQAGSRLAEVFHKKGYDVGVINTSAQDLEFIDIPVNQKLLLEGSLGGTGKDLDLGREIFSESAELLESFVGRVIDGNNMVYLTVSGGGGTGSSSVDTLIPMLFETGTPVGVIYVLPKATEDAQSKKNSIETLSRLARLTTDNIVSNLIVVDNARIEQIYANLSQSKFWEAANNAIVEPLHLFNRLTAQPSRFTSLDPSDFGRIISCGDCSIYGVMEVDDYMEETALAEAVIDSLNSNMLASGFDIAQTRAGGVIITGPAEVLEQIPAININYCFHMISEQTNGASIYQGVYSVDSDADSVKIYSWFAGLGLPKDRVENLKRESEEQSAIASEKERNRTAAMTLDLGEDKVNTVAEEVNRKIKKKKSSFNRLQRGARGSIIDRRKKR